MLSNIINGEKEYMWLALFLTICWGSIANPKKLGLRLVVVW